MSDITALLDAAAKYHAMGWKDGANNLEPMETRDPDHWPVLMLHQSAYQAAYFAAQDARHQAGMLCR